MCATIATFDYAEVTGTRAGATARYARALEVSKTACAKKKKADACFVAADVLARGLAGRAKLDDAQKAAKSACDLGHARACAWPSAPASASDASELKTTCELVGGAACFQAATAMLDGQGATMDKAEARRLHRAGCDSGAAKSCEALARTHEDGGWSPINDSAALWYRERACTLGIEERVREPSGSWQDEA